MREQASASSLSAARNHDSQFDNQMKTTAAERREQIMMSGDD
jgi:hypothetical protein